MKKVFSCSLILALCFMPFLMANASDTPSGKIYTKVTTSAGAATLVDITTIVPGKSRILGWSVAPTVGSAGSVQASIHDVAAAASASSTNLFGELACANTTSMEQIYPYPKDISAGLVILQGAGSVVTVFYENTIP